MPSAPAVQSNKAARGTKRLCQACAVRFYDLGRDPIVCPACSAKYTPAAQPTADSGRRAAPVASKTGWRQSSKRPGPVPPTPPSLDAEDAAPAEVVDAEDLEVATEEVAVAAPEDDTVLEQDGDDADFTGLVEVDVENPKES